MIYFCADDYGLNDISSMHTKQCADKGALNKISVFPNFETVNLNELTKDKNIRISLHLNLVEGKCMADACEIDMIADKNGNLKHTFGGLFILNLLHKKEFETQIYKEIKAQILYWNSILPENVPFCIDSHQHTHMIPAVFKALTKVLNDEKIKPEYLRIPAEPIIPYIKTPSLYFTYNPVNIIKQWLLKMLWSINKKHIKSFNLPVTYFMGILFSGKMDAKRVTKILPKYMKLAKNNDIEVLFHPGYSSENKTMSKDDNIAFTDFYLSENRKTEFDSVIKLSERSVL